MKLKTCANENVLRAQRRTVIASWEETKKTPWRRHAWDLGFEGSWAQGESEMKRILRKRAK